MTLIDEIKSSQKESHEKWFDKHMDWGRKCIKKQGITWQNLLYS